MKKSIPWSYRPYQPCFFESGDIYVPHVIPYEDRIEIEWLGKHEEVYDVLFRERDQSRFIKYATVSGTACMLNDLKPDTDYEIQIRCGEKKSRIRLAHTGSTVGTAVNYLHPEDTMYSFSGHCLCSPSLVRHPDGCLLASMDVFAGGEPQNLTLIYRSDDEGKSWKYVCELMPCFWGKMFIHKGELYMLSVSTEYGDLLIGKSTDCGQTWEAPTVLMRGSGRCHHPGVHKNPQNVIYYNGRIYNTLEWGAWNAGYHAPMIMSCDENADLLDASNWTIAPPVMYDPSWPGVADGPSTGNIEGTLVVAPDGRLLNVMRYDTSRTTPSYGLVLAFAVDTDDPAQPLTYDHAIQLPGNLSKFTIKEDPQTGWYYTLLTRITNEKTPGMRNLLSLMVSRDLESWRLVKDLLDYRHMPPQEVGFQYVDFEIEGDDIIYLCRTAINKAENFHNSNYITFHRIQNFREENQS